MFRMMATSSPGERIAELVRFLEHWYGPHQPQFGDPADRLAAVAMPDTLRRFYALAGRWPSPHPYDDEGERFYEGIGGHHLLPLDRLQTQPDGRLVFFVEYQGDWKGHVDPAADDPPVLITGRWDDPEPGDGTRQVSAALSRFLVTHCMMATLYESSNSHHLSESSNEIDQQLNAWFERERGQAELLWEAEPDGCPQYDGRFYLLGGRVLVVTRGQDALKFGARFSDGAGMLEEAIRA